MEYSGNARETNRFMNTVLLQNCSEKESVEGRRFAMMAARALDALCFLGIFSSALHNVFVSGSENGMSEV